MSTLGTILRDNWKWRTQIFQLGVFDLKKQSRGAVLGPIWFVIKPSLYVFCFWFALEIGLRSGGASSNGAPYILWLCSGIIPWFFMRDMLTIGVDVMHRYPYLVNKVKFPLSGISTIYMISAMLLQLLFQAILLGIYFLCGQPLSLYLLQIPVLIVFMGVFWWLFSILVSPLCVFSKDVKNLMAVLSTPFFWLSGVIFNVRNISIDWIQTLLLFNPITFFVTGFRDALYDQTWIWDDPWLCAGFAVVFAITLAMAVFVYARTSKGVADVL